MNKRTTDFFSFRLLLSGIVLGLGISSLPVNAATTEVDDNAGIVVPGYGPGIAGHVTIGPTMPVCQVGVPCDKPYDGAIVQILNANRTVVGTAVANLHGGFIVSLPPGDYITHIMTVDYPRCPETNVTVGKKFFTLTSVVCDTLIR